MSPSLRASPLLRLLALAGLLSAGCSAAPDGPTARETPPAPPSQDQGFSLRDLNGKDHLPFAEAAVKAVVLLFVLADCPIANAYAPEINRLDQDYGSRGVRFLLVQVDPDLQAEEAARHAREYGYTCPVVLDGEHALVRRT